MQNRYIHPYLDTIHQLYINLIHPNSDMRCIFARSPPDKPPNTERGCHTSAIHWRYNDAIHNVRSPPGKSQDITLELMGLAGYIMARSHSQDTLEDMLA
eukprot:2300736-Prymnesium_polylepis.1